jgi:two-component system, OmpR family, phosphate regulon response regulator PhoB
VVEDEPAQREVLAYNLEAEGFKVAKAETGDEALLLVEEETPDIIVLDWMLPGVSGIEVCRRVKSKSETRGIPIIMLSARSEEVDRVRGLETGADDYVIKPYSVVELMARVRSQLRRTRPTTVGQRLEFEDIVLDSETHRVTRGEAHPQARPDRVPAPVDLHGEARPGLEPRAASRPGLGARHLCRYAHGRRPHRAAAQGADGPGHSDPIRTVRGAGYALG